MSDQKPFAGRAAIVTGGTRGIGRAIVVELAQRGADVAFNYAKSAEAADALKSEIEALGVRALSLQCDVGNTAAAGEMVQQVKDAFGRIDYLVNNAAVRQEKTIEHMTFEDWRRITGIILDGAFHCVKACLTAIKRSDAGSIINVGGLTGAMGSPDRVHVVTAKAGLAGFTRGLAMELAPHKITVNTLVPAMLARPDRPNEIPSHPLYRPVLGRAAWPTDFAPLTRFLLGPGARYITGQIINVNGGTYFGT